MAAPAGAATGHTTHPVGTTATDYPNNGVGRTGAGYDDGYSYGGKGRPGLHRHDSQPGFPVHRNRRLANPSPLGMFALASTLLMWSLFNARTRHIYQTNAIIGMALAVGGLCQLLAGMWEFVTGNTFAATAFTILGGFWISYGVLYWPSSGSLSAYNDDDLGSALGIYYMVWMIVALMLLLGTFRGSVPLAGTFFFMFLMFLLLGVAHFNDSTGALRAGGILGCISAMLAFYTGATGLHTRDTTYYNLPAIGLARRQDAADTRY